MPLCAVLPHIVEILQRTDIHPGQAALPNARRRFENLSENIHKGKDSRCAVALVLEGNDTFRQEKYRTY
jgi:hypothetical protein